jgi:predicted RNA-binding protein associated with RNAse of E/G family
MPDLDDRTVRWDGRKWPDLLHWQFAMTRLGEDEHGVWLFVPAGTVVRRGLETPRVLEDGFVSLVPADGWWEAEFCATHPRHEVYVNIGTPCEWHPGRVRQVDLDLDVIRAWDGAVETLDEDEFADHQVRLAYPRWLIEGARDAAAEVATHLAHREEPFGEASRRWMAVAGLGETRGLNR